MLFRARDNLPGLVDLADHDAGHVVRALGAHNRVRQVKRHAAARDLRRVDAVAANAGRGVHECNNLTPGLQKLEAHDEADVAAAEHQHALAGLDAVQVHHRLRGARADHAGQRPARERQRILRSAGRHENRVALYVADLVADAHEDFLFLVKPQHRRVEHDPDPRVRRLF